MVADLGDAAGEGNADSVPVITEGVAGLPGMEGIWTWDTGAVGVVVEIGAVDNGIVGAVGIGKASDWLARNSPCATHSHIKQS